MPNAHDLQHQRLDNDIAAVYHLVAQLGRRQLRHEKRFAQFAAETATRLERVDGRLDGIDGRLDGIDGRLDGIDGRLNGITDALATVIELVRARPGTT